MSSEATIQKLESMRDSLLEFHNLLEQEEYADAAKIAHGLAGDTDCPMCQAVEDHLSVGCLFIARAPTGRAEGCAEAVQLEARHYIDLLNSELADATQGGD